MKRHRGGDSPRQSTSLFAFDQFLRPCTSIIGRSLGGAFGKRVKEHSSVWRDCSVPELGDHALKHVLRRANEVGRTQNGWWGAMNDIEVARRLLTELREAYGVLPQHIQVQVACLLRESTLPRQTGQQACEPTLRAPRQS